MPHICDLLTEHLQWLGYDDILFIITICYWIELLLCLWTHKHELAASQEIWQASAVADEPTRRAASRQTCCKLKWMLSVVNLRPN